MRNCKTRNSIVFAMIKLTKAEGIRAGYDKQEGFVDV